MTNTTDLTAPEAVERLIAEIPGVKDTPQDVWDLQERTFATLRTLSAALDLAKLAARYERDLAEQALQEMRAQKARAEAAEKAYVEQFDKREAAEAELTTLKAELAEARQDALSKMPPDCAPKGVPVLVAGGIAMRKTGDEWFSGMCEPAFSRPLNWQPQWWAPIPQQNEPPRAFLARHQRETDT